MGGHLGQHQRQQARVQCSGYLTNALSGAMGAVGSDEASRPSIPAHISSYPGNAPDSVPSMIQHVTNMS